MNQDQLRAKALALYYSLVSHWADDLRGNVLDILRRAEVLDGQIIVFREAVALLSLLLAGCPNDHGTRTPCEWVHDQVRGDKVFNLLGATACYGMLSALLRNVLYRVPALGSRRSRRPGSVAWAF